MSLILGTLLLLGQSNPFSTAPTVESGVRLALSPKLDGAIVAEEWDPFEPTQPVSSYFQWEPGQLHIAAIFPTTKDLVVSLDLSGNGWLKGRDNIEVRVHWAAAGPEVSARFVDGTPVSGPVWAQDPALIAASKFAGSATDDRATIELTLFDPGTFSFPGLGGKIGLRFDTFEPESKWEAYLPRALASVELGTERALGLPKDLRWKTDKNDRVVTPGSSTKIRLTFNGTDALGLGRISYRTEGLAREATESIGRPFPPFDNKSRAFVDYETAVSKEALPGYRILRAEITQKNGEAIVLQSSYFVAPILTFELEKPKKLLPMDEPRAVRIGVVLKSNSLRRLDGTFSVVPPNGFTVDKGNDKRFVIYNSMGSKRQVFDLNIPGGFKGTAPLILKGNVGGKLLEQTVWVRIEP